MKTPEELRAESRATCGKRSVAAACAALVMVVALHTIGCESGGSSGAPAGTSTLQGTIVSFSAGSAFYAPAIRPRGLAGIIRGIGELVVPSACAAMPGVTVRMMGTDLETTTADDGSFVMSGVPAGDHQLAFSMNGMTALMDVSVPDNATVFMSDIAVQGSSVHVGHMSTQMHGSMNSDGTMMHP